MSRHRKRYKEWCSSLIDNPFEIKAIISDPIVNGSSLIVFARNKAEVTEARKAKDARFIPATFLLFLEPSLSPEIADAIQQQITQLKRQTGRNTSRTLRLIVQHFLLWKDCFNNSSEKGSVFLSRPKTEEKEFVNAIRNQKITTVHASL